MSKAAHKLLPLQNLLGKRVEEMMMKIKNLMRMLQKIL